MYVHTCIINVHRLELCMGIMCMYTCAFMYTRRPMYERFCMFVLCGLNIIICGLLIGAPSLDEKAGFVIIGGPEMAVVRGRAATWAWIGRAGVVVVVGGGPYVRE